MDTLHQKKKILDTQLIKLKSWVPIWQRWQMLCAKIVFKQLETHQTSPPLFWLFFWWQMELCNIFLQCTFIHQRDYNVMVKCFFFLFCLEIAERKPTENHNQYIAKRWGIRRDRITQRARILNIPRLELAILKLNPWFDWGES